MDSAPNSIVIAPYAFLSEVKSLKHLAHAVSILGDSDGLPWPDFGLIPTLRLRADDIHAPATGMIAPAESHIRELIEFGRRWNGEGCIACHCKAGTSRSVAAAAILAAVLNSPESEALVRRVLTAK